MNRWDNIQTSTEIIFILDSILNNIKNKKIKRIFSFEEIILKKKDKLFYADTIEEPIYILFDDDYCLILDFPFYSDLSIEYRKLDKNEHKKVLALFQITR